MPLWIVGPQGLRQLFRDARPPLGRRPWVGAACLALPPLLGYSYAFPRRLPKATPRILGASAAIAVLNATLEEVLWRGLYPAAFPDNPVLGYL